MTDEFRTIAGEFRHAIDPIKGSRFLGCAAPAPTLEEARAFVERVREEHRGASHHCWGARLGGDAPETRADDDGEPSGSAGRPIAQQIEGHDLLQVVVVVVRWFGGTKLGVGGLMRAYGGCAGQTLDRAPLRRVVITERLELVHPYDCSGAVAGVLANHRLEPCAAEYGAQVRLTLQVPRRSLEDFRRELTDRTAGQAQVTPS